MLRTLLACLLLSSLPLPALAGLACDGRTRKICFEEVRSGDAIELYLVNRFAVMTVTVTVDWTTKNLRSDAGKGRTMVVPPKERLRLVRFTKGQKGKPWHYDYNFKWSRGDITARESGHRYRPPFAPGAAFPVLQSCDGSFSHNGLERFAVDFDMPVGTPVHAARAGRVVALRNNSDRGGPSEAFANDANFVVLEHEDRTLGSYYHFRRGGVAVDIGQRIPEGGYLGQSGNTGFSTEPHLHFAVTKGSKGSKEESLRFAFATPQGPVSCPAPGTALRAR